MKKEKRKILIIDDEPDMQQTLRSILKNRYEARIADSGSEGLNKLKAEAFSLVLLDLRMPKMDGMAALSKIRELDPSLPVVMVTASKDLKSAVEAMKGGAQDYVTKPFEVEELLLVVESALEKGRLEKENQHLKQTIDEEKYLFSDLIGETSQIKKILDLISQIRTADSAVLISGESGTGKEVVAKAIHRSSRRSNKPFIALNCAAIPENLIESELFGHERGAFTGALERRAGKFELADGGTLFWDEIGCMPAAMQSKLLRVLEGQTFERVGGNNTLEVDVRIISATNIDFAEAIKDKTFREDLYYRLNVIPIQLPPLRERKADIPLFVEYFVNKFNKVLNKSVEGFSPEALQLLVAYPFPGNVRELQNLIERLIAISKTKTINKEDLACLTYALSSSAYDPDLSVPLLKACENFERYFITRVLEQHTGNQSAAADAMQVARSTLRSRLSALGMKQSL